MSETLIEARPAPAMRIIDRILLLATALLAAYQVTAGIEGLPTLVILLQTVAFGVLLVACLLLIIFGYEALRSPVVVIVAAVLPLALSLALIYQSLPALAPGYVGVAAAGLLAVALSRFLASAKLATIILALVHGMAGALILALPLYLTLRGATPAGFALVSLGGGLIDLGGLALASLRASRPVLPERRIVALLAPLLLAMTAAFVAGLAQVR
jgi:hypothetical protein